jgi:hypothetical protein
MHEKLILQTATETTVGPEQAAATATSTGTQCIHLRRNRYHIRNNYTKGRL